MKLGVQNNLMLPEDLVKKAEYLKSKGINNFEIDGSLLINNYDDVKKMNEIINVRTVCGGYRNWIGSYKAEERERCIEDIKLIIDKLDKLGGGGIVVPAAWALGSYRLPKVAPERSDDETFDVLVTSLKTLDQYCENKKVKIFLEPLNRYQDFMINTVQQAVDLIKAGDLSNTLITADIYHMNIEEDNIIKSIEENIDYIGHIHIAENHRYEPGTGSIDFKNIFNTLSKLDYTGNIVYECRFKEETLDSFEKSISFVQGKL